MSLDFLRSLAFSGELFEFFREDPFGLNEKGANGIQLRFDDGFMKAVFYGIRDGHDEATKNSYQGRPASAQVSSIIQEMWYGNRTAIEQRSQGFHTLAGWLNNNEGNKRKAVTILVDVADPKNPLFSDGPTQYEGFRIKYRVAGPIEAQYVCGDSIKAGAARLEGTVCGFFRDTLAETTYALTCGHVGRKKGIAITGNARRQAVKLGRVDSVIFPTGTGPCNRFAEPAANGVDAALIRVDPHTSIETGEPRRIHPISAITQGDLVEFRGRGRQRQAQVLSATIWKQIDLFKTKTMYCCGDIFEIGYREPVYFQTRLSQPGDSGAAVLRPGLPDEWFGMLIGGHGSSSYASYATHIVDWAAGIYPNIVPIP
ncbi:hypothetical protein V1283_009003 [Bradyrhizobium sp. AZCC 2262]|uniref:hypothetical protein n=1 Tax=Bradyrhizobium sp. AZCC 2262 TaxID=3117022 RepID=UPI002FF137C9